MNVQEIYSKRFQDTFKKRELTWKVLCDNYFSKYIHENDSVLEIAAGYCHFINNIKAKKKIALDLNPDVEKFANEDVEVIVSSSSKMDKIDSDTVECVFVSNFFEHITKQEIIKTLKESHRVLKSGGKIIVLQPSIRYLASEYWMFFDHITPLDEYSLAEALSLSGFTKYKIIGRFLPFTMQGKLPVGSLIIKLYLMLPILWLFFGKQSLLVFEK